MSVMYASTAFAARYFADRPDAEAFLALDAPARVLGYAGQLIADFCTFYDEEGFAYVYDAADAPDWLMRATCEEALYLANLGKDPARKLDVLTLGIVKTDDGTTFDHRFQPDILGVTCRRILTANGGEIAPEAYQGETAASGVNVAAVVK